MLPNLKHLERGNIVTFSQEGEVTGWTEYWYYMIEVTGRSWQKTLVIQGRFTGVIDGGIQGLQCNLCGNASVSTDWGYKLRGYRGYGHGNTGITV